MPLETEADYEQLAAHLREIDLIVEPFSQAHGYRLMRWPLGGRYPNRMMDRQCGRVTQSIQITMDLRPDGERFDRFFPDIPYTVFGAAWMDDSATRTRWSAPTIRNENIPFTVLLRVIPIYLSHFDTYLSSLNEDSIRAFQATSKLGDPGWV